MTTNNASNLGTNSIPIFSGLILNSTLHALGLNTLTTAQFTSQSPSQGAVAFTTSSETLIFFDGMQNQLAASQSYVTSNFVSLTGSYADPSWITSLSASKLTGQVALANGGTNASLTANNGGIFYSTASAGAILAGTATAGKILQSGATAAPSWSTPTYPSASGSAGQILRSDGTNNVYSTATFSNTYTASNLLYSNGANTVTGLATANNGTLVTDGSGVPSISSTLPNAVQTNITQLGSSISTVYKNSAQPRFFARYTATASNVTGNAVQYTLVPDTADVNVGTMINTSTGTITIPNAGFYNLGGFIFLGNLGASNTDVLIRIVTTARTYIGFEIGASSRDAGNALAFPFNIVQQFSLNDTITFTIEVDGGTQSINVKGVAPQITYLYGYLLD